MRGKTHLIINKAVFYRKKINLNILNLRLYYKNMGRNKLSCIMPGTASLCGLIFIFPPFIRVRLCWPCLRIINFWELLKSRPGLRRRAL